MVRPFRQWSRVACLMFLLAVGLPARAAGLEVDLLGWRLLQLDAGVAAALGEPFHTRSHDGWTDRAYRLQGNGNSYLVVSIHDDRPHYIQALQVTGYSPDKPLFAGLHLGDTRAAVAARLGAPDRVTTLDIAPIAPKTLEVHHYDSRNYSLEFDPDGRLYSARITCVEDMVASPADDATSPDPWAALAVAVLAKDFARLEPLLRPDVEVYRGDDLIKIDQRYGDFLAAPKPTLLAAFFDPATGVAAAARGPAPDMHLRVAEQVGTGLVYKFAADSVLQEVVFFPYLGGWRVYEVQFRDANTSTAPVERG